MAAAAVASSSSSSSSEDLFSGGEEKWKEMLSGRDLPEARNSEEIVKKINELTGGKIRTRFPPEPNGYLHIGHAKSMNFNFGLTKKFGGGTIMRFDDTNPEAEDPIYFQSILENVKWMGHQYSRITYSSDYFQQLYEYAIELIKKGKAYVCHQTQDEMKESKNNGTESPYRNRSIEENLEKFDDMKKGKYDEGKAVLRLKGDLSSSNPQMWDIVAYRIKYVPHPHAGAGWCIYPSYDYSHCLIDSIEMISHSLCTLEFEVRREIYYWILHELNLYKPKVWEYSRLNIEHNVLSKRRLIKMVQTGIVRGWDDPRMLTIDGLRRRGYTAASINEFCRRVGISRNENFIPMNQLENCIRDDLENTAYRRFVVQDPIEVIITNYPSDKVEIIQAPHLPKDESVGNREMPFSKIVYIDSSDIRLTDDKDFFGLAPGKSVRLKYAYNIKADKIETNAEGKIIRVLATVDVENKEKCKGKIHWVAQPAPGKLPLVVELRLYDLLFKSANPMELDDWITDINRESLIIIPNAYAEPSLSSVPLPTYEQSQKFQFERLGFFVIDKDTATEKKPVFNLTVSLKESKPKVVEKPANNNNNNKKNNNNNKKETNNPTDSNKTKEEIEKEKAEKKAEKEKKKLEKSEKRKAGLEKMIKEGKINKEDVEKK